MTLTHLPLRVRQRVEFFVQSVVVPADEITAALGLPPDTTDVRGSQSADPVRPTWHNWAVTSPEGDHDLGEQVEALVARRRPLLPALVGLVDRLRSNAADVGPDGTQAGAGLLIVRYFGDNSRSTDRLGLHLSEPVVQFLATTRASVDLDEYDYR